MKNKHWLLILCAFFLTYASALPELSIWKNLLTKYVDTTNSDKLNRFRYSQVSAEDKLALHSFLIAAQATKVSALPKSEQRAFWINLYNAQTIAIVLEHYPIKSIRDIKLPGTTQLGPWDARLLKIEGKEISLNDIENGILRVQWKDFRIHFALNCASIGCPNLINQPFTAANTEKLLTLGARQFLASTRGIEFIPPLGSQEKPLNTEIGNKLVLAQIFDWYKLDFGKDEKELLITLSKYAPEKMVQKLKNWKGKIEYQYNWNLNEAP